MVSERPIVIAKGLWKRSIPFKETKADLHSIFDSCINLTLLDNDKTFVTILHPSRSLVPFGIQLQTSDQFSKIQTEYRSIRISQEILRTKDICLDFNNSNKKDLKINPVHNVTYDSLMDLRLALMTYKETSVRSQASKYNFVKQLDSWIKRENLNNHQNIVFDLSKFEPFTKILSSKALVQRFCTDLIGWGEGSTPAGDDFLLGCLAACWIIPEIESSMRRFYKTLYALLQKNQTTLISQQYLKYALQGEFAEPIDTLFSCLANNLKIEKTLLDQLFYGFSSGKDFLWGLIWTFKQLAT